MQDLSKDSESRLPQDHERNVKEAALFIETLDYLLKVIYKNYTSDSVIQLVNWYLYKNEYDYLLAKKHLFAEITSQLKKQADENNPQS